LTDYWFISTRYRRNSRLALFTFGLAFVVILLGAFTRLTDAGLSCPDWPHCYGFLTAPHTTSQILDAVQKYPMMPVNIKKAWTEMVHRYFAGTEGILILLLAASILFARKVKNAKSVTIGIALIALLSVQILLGMLTVTEKLKPVIVLSHLLTGVSILSVLWWAYLDLHMRDDSFVNRTSRRILPWLWIGFFIVAMQITLGGWVSTHYAGLACIDFPYCNGKLIPAMQWQQWDTDLITIHMLHRIGAFVTASYLSIMALSLIFLSRSFRSMAILILGLIALQITLGIFNIIWLRPVWIALIHQMVAILLLLTMITALVKAYFESRDARHETWVA
jgi:cytochrome c oxidase assembly protein subunit 15